jgi:hypothetical protein
VSALNGAPQGSAGAVAGATTNIAFSMTHFEDYELAQATHAELVKLRSRPMMPTIDEIMTITDKAGISSTLPRFEPEGRR